MDVNVVGFDGSKLPENNISDRYFFGVNENKMQSLMTDITTLEKQAETAALRMTDDVYRQTLSRVQLAMGTGSMSLTEATDLAIKDFLDKGINCIVYSDGKRVNIADYVRMALRTTSTRASLQGQAKRFAELGFDTVLVSQYGGCSKTCEPWQGRVYIDDVFTLWDGEVEERAEGELWGKSKYCGVWFPLLSTAIHNGLYHPNCRHTMSQYIHGITKIPEPIPAEKIKRQRELESRQRAMERKIRKLKRFAEGTLDPETAKAYCSKLREAQHELKAFIDEHSDVLHRDYSREKYYGDGLTNKAKKVDIFDDSEVPLNAELTSEEIIEELKTTKIGNQTLKDIENLPQRIKLTYENRVDGVRGDERNGEIRIFLRNCKNVKWAVRSIIHEITHWKYGISQSQWSECVCLAQELKHARNRDYLTISEKRTIIKAVKEVYPEFNWRKGGYVYGRKK